MALEVIKIDRLISSMESDKNMLKCFIGEEHWYLSSFLVKHVTVMFQLLVLQLYFGTLLSGTGEHFHIDE